jgi:chromosome segregation ATPase
MRHILLAIGLLLLGSQVASAQSIEDRLRDQLRSTTQQLQQLQDNQASLQAAKAAAEQERDSLKKQVAALQAGAARAKGSVKAEQAQAALQEEVGKDKQALAQAADAVKQAQTDHDRLQAIVTNQATLLNACQAKNADLFKVSNDILDTFAKMDLSDAVGLNEPFIQDTRVQLENMVQDYGDRIYDGKYDPRTVKAPPKEPASQQPGAKQASPSAQPEVQQQQPPTN